MLNIDTIASVIKNTVNKLKTPAQALPPLLLYCTAIKRPGLSPSMITSKVISNNESLGINTGTNPDGSPNIVNEYSYNVVKAVVDAISQDGVVQVAIPAGSLMVQVTGANAGGPVVSVGTNITNTIAYGIVR